MGDYANDQLRGWIRAGMPWNTRRLAPSRCSECGGHIRTVTGNFTHCTKTGDRHDRRTKQAAPQVQP